MEAAVPFSLATLPHRFVTIRDTRGNEIVTILEVLSPWNKTGYGQREYQAKQREVLVSDANLVEIDLLRRGGHAVAVPEDRIRPSDYRVCIHRAHRQAFELIRFGVKDALPNIPVPLRDGEPDVVLHLGAVFTACYDGGGYAYKADYPGEPDPPLDETGGDWARGILRQIANGQGPE